MTGKMTRRDFVTNAAAVTISSTALFADLAQADNVTGHGAFIWEGETRMTCAVAPISSLGRSSDHRAS
ncbi:hypothetical protein [Pseudovibrio sp. Tun.PSC04-5.I4]|uniref:hypothetical protein n=1 Tax=Pseudovibrio sp. Tun.PSC04-5.I4 TaxID=1798213 RepID=UPI00088F7084|nr:hypothetical protein [Pseudovibrio sp. Tun.PSC04-5.I4]SDR19571.1 hypothetical protein SAMN04515695_3327 [Pseudovibrio sp. Tun.PSC04-5.I4]